MQIQQLPNTVLGQIIEQIDIKSLFNFAISCRTLYKRVRHLLLSRPYNLQRNIKVGSFFTTTVQSINLVINPSYMDYDYLKFNLDKFYYLKTLTVVSDQTITVAVATRLLWCTPYSLMRSVYLLIPPQLFRQFNIALERCQRKDVILASPG